MVRHHTIITGTGRCGSTFLVRLFAELGYETGLDRLDPIDDLSKAGLEYNIRLPDCPYISKSPLYCHIIEEILNNDELCIDHVIIPVRLIEDVVSSRLRIHDITKTHDYPGSSIFTSDYHELELYSLRKVYDLIFHLSASVVPVHLIQFPKFARDPAYLRSKVPLFEKVEYDEFFDKFKKIANLDHIHNFDH